MTPAVAQQSLPAGAARLRSIDFLRGVAALSVVGLHALSTGGLRGAPPAIVTLKEGFERAAVFGVILFFVISGFCIHLSTARAKRVTGEAPPFHFRRFWARRFWRLYPTYFVVLCGSMGVVAAMLVFRPGASILDAYPEPRARWILADFLAHATMLHGLIPRFDNLGGNSPLWTIAREEYLYLLYPILLFLRGRSGVLITGALVAVSGFALNVMRVQTGIDAEWVRALATSTLNYWVIWYLGMLAAEAAWGLVRLPFLVTRIWMVPVWLVVAFYALPLLRTQLWGVACFTLVNFCVRRELDGRWPAARLVGAITATGVISYSLYLVHWPVQNVLLSLSLKLGPATSLLTLGIRAIALAAGSYVAAVILFRLVEVHFINRRRATKTDDEQTATAAAAAMLAGEERAR